MHFVDNAYVKAIYEAGALGLAYVAWGVGFYVLALRFLWRARSGSARWARAVPVLVMSLILSVSLFSDSLMTYPWSLAYWIAAGGVAVQVRPRHPERPARSTTARDTAKRTAHGAHA